MYFYFVHVMEHNSRAIVSLRCVQGKELTIRKRTKETDSLEDLREKNDQKRRNRREDWDNFFKKYEFYNNFNTVSITSDDGWNEDYQFECSYLDVNDTGHATQKRSESKEIVNEKEVKTEEYVCGKLYSKENIIENVDSCKDLHSEDLNHYSEVNATAYATEKTLKQIERVDEKSKENLCEKLSFSKENITENVNICKDLCIKIYKLEDIIGSKVTHSSLSEENKNKGNSNGQFDCSLHVAIEDNSKLCLNTQDYKDSSEHSTGQFHCNLQVANEDNCKQSINICDGDEDRVKHSSSAESSGYESGEVGSSSVVSREVENGNVAKEEAALGTYVRNNSCNSCDKNTINREVREQNRHEVQISTKNKEEESSKVSECEQSDCNKSNLSLTNFPEEIYVTDIVTGKEAVCRSRVPDTCHQSLIDSNCNTFENKLHYVKEKGNLRIKKTFSVKSELTEFINSNLDLYMSNPGSVWLPLSSRRKRKKFCFRKESFKSIIEKIN